MLKTPSKNVKIAAIVLAAGSGERFGANLPKQYLNLAGKPVLKWSLDTLKNHPLISDVVVVVNHDHLGSFKEAADKIEPALDVQIVTGGISRQESVARGLEALKVFNPDFVLIHDAARPLVSADLITALCNETVESNAVIPAIPITDTVKRREENCLRTENRENLFAAQTPQAFSFDLIHSLHKKYPHRPVTDDASLCEMEKLPVKIIPGELNNIKITKASDFLLAEQYVLTRYNEVRCGQGYDSHKLIDPTIEKTDLIICGVAIPHYKVLKGHSDADVGLHAITDAILATICEGDIGEHFSPKDEEWRNADSSIFLKYAASLLADKDGIISHVDVTIIAQEPKISPHREVMRDKVAHILSIPISSVSVKASTTEGLGFTGREEGITAQAIVTARFKHGKL